MVSAQNYVGIKHAFMPITVNVVTEEEYNQWLEKAKVEFAKEEINNNIKVVKKIKEINNVCNNCITRTSS